MSTNAQHQHEKHWFQVIEVVKTVDLSTIPVPVNPAGRDDDDYRFRIEILRHGKRLYKPRAWRIEFYRIQPTPRQGASLKISDDVHKLILVHDSYIGHELSGSSPGAALEKAIQKVETIFDCLLEEIQASARETRVHYPMLLPSQPIPLRKQFHTTEVVKTVVLSPVSLDDEENDSDFIYFRVEIHRCGKQQYMAKLWCHEDLYRLKPSFSQQPTDCLADEELWVLEKNLAQGMVGNSPKGLLKKVVEELNVSFNWAKWFGE